MSVTLARLDAGWPSPTPALRVSAAVGAVALDDVQPSFTHIALARARARMAGAMLLAMTLHAAGLVLHVGLPPADVLAPRALSVTLATPAPDLQATASPRAPTPAPAPTAHAVPAPMRPARAAETAVVAPPAPVAADAPVAATDDTPIAPAPLTREARVDTNYLDNPRPAYPLVSRRLGEQGTVLLRVTVGESGTVLAVDLEESCGHARLDDAALRAVRGWRFLPARQAGIAVTSTVLVPVTFALGKS